MARTEILLRMTIYHVHQKSQYPDKAMHLKAAWSGLQNAKILSKARRDRTTHEGWYVFMTFVWFDQ